MAALSKIPLERRFMFGAHLAAWLSTVPTLADARRLAHPRGLSAFVNVEFLLSPLALGLLSAIYLAAAVAFAIRRHSTLAGFAIVLLLGLVAHLETSLYPGPGGIHHGKLMPADATLAWLIASLWMRRESDETREAFGREAIAGAAAACYILAAIAKFQSGGLSWVKNTNLPLLAAERAVGAWYPIALLRDGFARRASTGASLSLSALALALELGSVALLFNRTRRAYAALLIGMHACIGLLLGYHYLDWILVLLAIWFSIPKAPNPSKHGVRAVSIDAIV